MRLRVFPKTLQTQKDILNFRLLYKLRISFDITRIFAEQGIQESLLSLKLSLLCKQNVFFQAIWQSDLLLFVVLRQGETQASARKGAGQIKNRAILKQLLPSTSFPIILCFRIWKSPVSQNIRISKENLYNSWYSMILHPGMSPNYKLLSSQSEALTAHRLE